MDALLSRIDATPGCSIKDSFASLDLAAYGFRVLFDAQWIVSRSIPPPLEWALSWEVVDSGQDLAQWEEAWRGGDDDGLVGDHDGDDTSLFRIDLLDHRAITVLAARVDGGVAAGAVLNRSENVIGISNFFSCADTEPAARSSCLAFAASLFPNSKFVGYETGDELVDALLHGFEQTGALRVWIRDH